MYIPEMSPGVKFQIRNAPHAIQLLLSGKATGSKQIILPEGSAISVVVKLTVCGAEF